MAQRRRCDANCRTSSALAGARRRARCRSAATYTTTLWRWRADGRARAASRRRVRALLLAPHVRADQGGLARVDRAVRRRHAERSTAGRATTATRGPSARSPSTDAGGFGCRVRRRCCIATQRTDNAMFVGEWRERGRVLASIFASMQLLSSDTARRCSGGSSLAGSRGFTASFFGSPSILGAAARRRARSHQHAATTAVAAPAARSSRRRAPAAEQLRGSRVARLAVRVVVVRLRRREPRCGAGARRRSPSATRARASRSSAVGAAVASRALVRRPGRSAASSPSAASRSLSAARVALASRRRAPPRSRSRRARDLSMLPLAEFGDAAAVAGTVPFAASSRASAARVAFARRTRSSVMRAAAGRRDYSDDDGAARRPRGRDAARRASGLPCDARAVQPARPWPQDGIRRIRCDDDDDCGGRGAQFAAAHLALALFDAASAARGWPRSVESATAPSTAPRGPTPLRRARELLADGGAAPPASRRRGTRRRELAPPRRAGDLARRRARGGHAAGAADAAVGRERGVIKFCALSRIPLAPIICRPSCYSSSSSSRRRRF